MIWWRIWFQWRRSAGYQLDCSGEVHESVTSRLANRQPRKRIGWMSAFRYVVSWTLLMCSTVLLLVLPVLLPSLPPPPYVLMLLPVVIFGMLVIVALIHSGVAVTYIWAGGEQFNPYPSSFLAPLLMLTFLFSLQSVWRFYIELICRSSCF